MAQVVLLVSGAIILTFVFRRIIFTSIILPKLANRKVMRARVIVDYTDGILAQTSLTHDLNSYRYDVGREEYASKLMRNKTAERPTMVFVSLLKNHIKDDDLRKIPKLTDENHSISQPALNTSYLTYWACHGSVYYKNILRNLVTKAYLKKFKISEELFKNSKNHLKKLQHQKASYAKELEKWKETSAICSSSSEMFERLKEGLHDNDPDLWHIICEQEVGNSEANLEILTWIASQHGCYQVTAAGIFCTMFTHDLLQYETIDACPQNLKERFALAKLIATRWSADEYIDAHVHSLLINDNIWSKEEAYDKKSDELLVSKSKLPWTKPTDIFREYRGRKPKSQYTYSVEFFSDEGGLKLAPPEKPSLLV